MLVLFSHPRQKRDEVLDRYFLNLWTLFTIIQNYRALQNRLLKARRFFSALVSEVTELDLVSHNNNS